VLAEKVGAVVVAAPADDAGPVLQPGDVRIELATLPA
jgi:hypothetical protein